MADATTSTTSGQLSCSVVTPDRILFESDASKVIVSGYDQGEIGFMPGHAPYIGQLGIGILRMETSEGTIRFGVYGGFVQVDHDKVTILANQAEKPEEVTDESLAEDREKLGECDTRTDLGYEDKLTLARRISIREKLRSK